MKTSIQLPIEQTTNVFQVVKKATELSQRFLIDPKNGTPINGRNHLMRLFGLEPAFDLSGAKIVREPNRKIVGFRKYQPDSKQQGFLKPPFHLLNDFLKEHKLVLVEDSATLERNKWQINRHIHSPGIVAIPISHPVKGVTMSAARLIFEDFEELNENLVKLRIADTGEQVIVKTAKPKQFVMDFCRIVNENENAETRRISSELIKWFSDSFNENLRFAKLAAGNKTATPDLLGLTNTEWKQVRVWNNISILSKTPPQLPLKTPSLSYLIEL